MTARLSTGRFFGETLRRRRSDRYTLSEVRYRGGIRIPEHSHERPIVNFVLAGRYTEYWGGERMECRTAETLFHPAGLVHSERFSKAGARCLAIEFDPGGLGLDDVQAFPSQTAVLPPGRWGWISARLLRELRASDDLSALVIEGLIGASDKLTLTDLVDIIMLVSYTGKERSEAEFRTLFERAGLTPVRTIRTASELHVLEARVT